MAHIQPLARPPATAQPLTRPPATAWYSLTPSPATSYSLLQPDPSPATSYSQPLAQPLATAEPHRATVTPCCCICPVELPLWLPPNRRRPSPADSQPHRPTCPGHPPTLSPGPRRPPGQCAAAGEARPGCSHTAGRPRGSANQRSHASPAAVHRCCLKHLSRGGGGAQGLGFRGHRF